MGLARLQRALARLATRQKPDDNKEHFSFQARLALRFASVRPIALFGTRHAVAPPRSLRPTAAGALSPAHRYGTFQAKHCLSADQEEYCTDRPR